ncbi:MAG: Gfo/Idh/MocA family oxidoreductase [Vicinamibacterales bacterium]
MTSSIRFAVIGCGRVARMHLDAITEAEGAVLVAVCDLDQGRAVCYSDEYRVPWFCSYHEMLSRRQVDAVAIITPSGMHAAHAIDVLQRYRVHVVVEKPVVLRLGDVDALQRAAHLVGRRVYPVFQNRYNKAVRRVREQIRAGALGKLALGTLRLRWCRPSRYYQQSPWRGTWAMDGGCLTNQGIHYLDLLIQLMGDVDSVTAFTNTAFAQVEVEDTVAASVRFASGALGQIEVTTAARPDDLDAELSVLGEHGTAVIGGLSANRLSVWTPDPSSVSSYSEDIPTPYGFGHKPFYRDVVADLVDGTPHPIALPDAARAIQLLHAIYRAAETEAVTYLADTPVSEVLGEPDPLLESLYTTPPPPGQASAVSPSEGQP